MRRGWIAALGVAGVLAGAEDGAAQSQTYTDAEQVVANLLRNYGPVPVTTYSRSTRCEGAPFDLSATASDARAEREPGREPPEGRRTICYPVTSSTTASRLLTASGIEIVAMREPRFEGTVTTSFPNDLVVQGQDLLNCDPSIAVTIGVALNTSVVRTTGAQVTRSVTRARGGTTTFAWTPQPFHIGASVAIGTESTVATTTSTSLSATIVRTSTGSVTLPPRSKMRAEISVHRMNIRAPFKMDVVLDAALTTNDRGFTRLAQIIPEADRTQTIEGYVETSDASDARMVYLPRTLTAADCPALPLVVAPDSQPPPPPQRFKGM